MASLEKAQPEQKVTRLLDLGFREAIEALRLKGRSNEIGRVLDRSAPDLRGAQNGRPEGGVGGLQQAIVIDVRHGYLLLAAASC